MHFNFELHSAEYYIARKVQLSKKNKSIEELFFSVSPPYISNEVLNWVIWSMRNFSVDCQIDQSLRAQPTVL